MQLDDWVLCRVRQRTDNIEPSRRQYNNLSKAKIEGYYNNYDPFGEEQINYFTEEEVAGADHGRESFNNSQINVTNSSMKDALETIKRVLSLGALDEQPNKRLRSTSPSVQ